MKYDPRRRASPYLLFYEAEHTERDESVICQKLRDEIERKNQRYRLLQGAFTAESKSLVLGTESLELILPYFMNIVCHSTGDESATSFMSYFRNLVSSDRICQCILKNIDKINEILVFGQSALMIEFLDFAFGHTGDRNLVGIIGLAIVKRLRDLYALEKLSWPLIHQILGFVIT
jgi:hypothetical protein